MAKALYGLIGYPLAHSFSPAYFAEKFEQEGVTDAAYDAFPISKIEEFPGLINAHPNLRGLNVTIPYKQVIIAFLDELNAAANAIGAVNCIDFRNGKLIGHNTDMTAFRESLKPLLQPVHTKALILGNGGATKAVAFALNELGISYEIISRKEEAGFLSYEMLTPALIADFKLIINTTPLGKFPDEHEAPDLPYEAISPQHLLYDLHYNPATTLFLKRGSEQGAATKNGLEMLHLQAAASWEIWNK